jgi:FkbM family methyltransferase
MNRSLINQLFRFLQIDFDYLFLPLSFSRKLKNILYADFLTVINLLLLKKNNFPLSKLNNNSITYDSPFATKTCLAAAYDFYIETNRGTIFNRKDPLIIDVGANMGQFLLSVKTLFPNAKVISIEPNPEVYNLLTFNSKNLKNVTLHNLALSNKKGNQSFFVSSMFSEWSSLINNIGPSKEIKVEITDADSLFKKSKTIDLLKIDVEGAEFTVVKGMKETIKKAKYLLIEVGLSRNLNNSASNKLIKFLLENNYSLFSVGRIFQAKKGGLQGAVDILFKNEIFEK